MYRCQICNKVVPPRTKAYCIPVETRFRRYPFRPKANRVVRENPDEDKKGKIVYIDDPGGEGYEIAREVLACPECAAQLKGEQQ